MLNDFMLNNVHKYDMIELYEDRWLFCNRANKKSGF